MVVDVLWALAAQSAVPQRRNALLLVEDDDHLLHTLRLYLQKKLPDVHVFSARSGPEALDILQDSKVDLIITDYKMPEMNGLEFLAEATRSGVSCPRIVITAFPELPEAAKSSLSGGPDLVVRKPFEPADLMALVRQSLGRRPAS